MKTSSSHLSHVCHIILAAEQAVEKALLLIDDKERKGGYFCVADLSGQVLATALIGEVIKQDKAQKYLAFCQEKAVRLARNPDHVSSWQSRNESKQQYGGAIRMEYLILSFSGFPELWDESSMVEVACNDGYFNFSQTRRNEIRLASNNPYITNSFANFPGWCGAPP